MHTDYLLSKESPFAHVWLAANYDKKLSKQQLLSTNIVQSSSLLSSRPISFQTTQTIETGDKGAITLRMSGQLLYGIVRIYSRKTKYLLDDVNDILFRLKTSFKYASGGMTLGPDGQRNVVNLPAEKTIINNVASITLPDKITELDLLYQDDLNLDDVEGRLGSAFFGAANAETVDETSFDRSIELPRIAEQNVTINDDDDDGFELNFDLPQSDDSFEDRSIEVGRNIQADDQNMQHSILSDLKDTDTLGDNLSFNMDLDDPLEVIEDDNISKPQKDEDEENDERRSDNVEQSKSNTVRHRGKIVGLTEDGHIRTTKRKLHVDSTEALETGITLQELKKNQQVQLMDVPFDYFFPSLSNNFKLSIIHNLASPLPSSNKRRKLWDIGLSEKTVPRNDEIDNRSESEVEDHSHYDLNFDLSLPELDSMLNDDDEGQNHESNQLDSNYQVSTTQSTTQVAGHLREMFNQNHMSVSLSQLYEKDINMEEKSEEYVPLGLAEKGNDDVKINKRREVTKCFFELLVLATNDCISIKQEHDDTHLGKDLLMESKDGLFNRFI
ncbi:Piso0_005769 [Millerozyma farinosa CBS 7064]|uniref:Piso0_005769 protein n=1 Tax=Pichia sorbitophila (strain ATCC MYA-4447 / BCRC 22081 / CBS 7064 / NBRC 10061 / NRRL Y-12695) TaxID=559304 RepID=G8XZW7_PICSO|nr:Piso0_005769 [Millerozyma farinosa CBS 7064]